jgi:hypothetical protein
MHKHPWKLVACLLLCAAVTGAARAQSPTPETMAAAHELVVTMRSADQFKALLPIIMKNLKPAIRGALTSSATSMPPCQASWTASTRA